MEDNFVKKMVNARMPTGIDVDFLFAPGLLPDVKSGHRISHNQAITNKLYVTVEELRRKMKAKRAQRKKDYQETKKSTSSFMILHIDSDQEYESLLENTFLPSQQCEYRNGEIVQVQQNVETVTVDQRRSSDKGSILKKFQDGTIHFRTRRGIVRIPKVRVRIRPISEEIIKKVIRPPPPTPSKVNEEQLPSSSSQTKREIVPIPKVRVRIRPISVETIKKVIRPPSPTSLKVNSEQLPSVPDLTFYSGGQKIDEVLNFRIPEIRAPSTPIPEETIEGVIRPAPHTSLKVNVEKLPIGPNLMTFYSGGQNNDVLNFPIPKITVPSTPIIEETIEKEIRSRPHTSWKVNGQKLPSGPDLMTSYSGEQKFKDDVLNFRIPKIRVPRTPIPKGTIEREIRPLPPTSLKVNGKQLSSGPNLMRFYSGGQKLDDDLLNFRIPKIRVPSTPIREETIERVIQPPPPTSLKVNGEQLPSSPDLMSFYSDGQEDEDDEDILNLGLNVNYDEFL